MLKKEVVEQHVAELGPLQQKANSTAEQIGEYRTTIADLTQKQAAAVARRASVEQVFTHDSGLNTALVCARSQRPHGSTTWTKTSRFRLRWATYRRFRIWILEAMTPQQPRHRKLAARARPTYVAMG